MALHWPTPALIAESRTTATRVTRGAISLSNPSHFPPMSYAKLVNPVALPLGRPRLSTSPAPTGSGTIVKTIGMVRVAWRIGPADALPAAITTSGANVTNSSAYLRLVSPPPPAQRMSIRMLRPSVQPNCCSPSTNALTSVGYSESPAVAGSRTPTRRNRSAGCDRAASGQATDAPRSDKNSRRLIASLEAQDSASYQLKPISRRGPKQGQMSALGQKQTHAVQQRMSGLPPKATSNATLRPESHPGWGYGVKV